MALSRAGNGRCLGTAAGSKRARAAFAKTKLKTDIHAAAFALPEWIRRLAK